MDMTDRKGLFSSRWWEGQLASPLYAYEHFRFQTAAFWRRIAPRKRAVQVLDISASECRKQSAECLRLRTLPGTSMPQAATLLAMARSWTALANQKARLEDLRREAAETANAREDVGSASTA